MSEGSNGKESSISKLESMESKLSEGLDQIKGDISSFESDEQQSSEYVNNLNSLSKDQVEELEHGLEVETFEGRKILKKLENSLGMEGESVKTLAQVVHRIDENNKDIESKEQDIDGMLKKLEQEADNGNVDEELAGKCLGEIISVKEEIKETADLEEETSEVSERLEEDLNESHQELDEMKADERELESEMDHAEEWAANHNVDEMQRFVDQEGAPDLVSEIQELKNEIRQQQSEETEFVQNLTQLAEEDHITEEHIDHLISQQQGWNTIAKIGVKNTSLGLKKFGDALFGFTPKGIAMGAAAGAAQEVDKDQVMNAVGKVSNKVRRTADEAESEVEASVEETQTAKDRLEKAKGS